MIQDANIYTPDDIANIKDTINQTLSGSIPHIPLNGCGRVYLCFGYTTVKKSSKLAKAIDGIGPIKVFSRPGYKGANFYMGYDNATGRQASVAEALAKNLNSAGFIAFVDYDAD